MGVYSLAVKGKKKLRKGVPEVNAQNKVRMECAEVVSNMTSTDELNEECRKGKEEMQNDINKLEVKETNKYKVNENDIISKEKNSSTSYRTNNAINESSAETEAATVELAEPSLWVERMTLTSTKALPSDLSPDDDPRREELFIQQTLQSVMYGISLLEKAQIPWKRPADYYAEMYKSDMHMNDIRRAMEAAKVRVEAQAHRRAMKDQKKYGKEVQAEILRQRAKYKRDLQDRLDDWKKKRKGDDVLQSVLHDEVDNDNDDSSTRINFRNNKSSSNVFREGGKGNGKVFRKGNFETNGIYSRDSKTSANRHRSAVKRVRELHPGKKSKRPGKNARSRRH